MELDCAYFADNEAEIDHAGARMVKDPQALYLAAWFHDSVFDVFRNDNEQRSAAAAVNVMSAMNLPTERMRNVQAMILCTRDHRCDSPDGRILIDADLAILGSTPEQYSAYADAIKRECAPIPEDRFRLGRMKVLQSLLNRGKIFQTMRGQRTYEEAARRNLARELAALTMSRPKITTTVAAGKQASLEPSPASLNVPASPRQLDPSRPAPLRPIANATRPSQHRRSSAALPGDAAPQPSKRSQ